MRLRSPLRGPFRRKVFRVRLGPGILRLGGSDPPPPPWGGARRARLPAQDSTLSWPIRSLHKLSQLPRPAVSYPPPRSPPSSELRLAGRWSTGRGQGGVSGSLLRIPTGADRRESVPSPWSRRASQPPPLGPRLECGPLWDGESPGLGPAAGRPLPAPDFPAASAPDAGR